MGLFWDLVPGQVNFGNLPSHLLVTQSRAETVQVSPAFTPHFFAFAQQVSRLSDGLPYVAPVILIRPPGQARTRSFTPWYEASQISSDVALTPERTIADAVT